MDDVNVDREEFGEDEGMSEWQEYLLTIMATIA
jgi:hypothetical protein